MKVMISIEHPAWAHQFRYILNTLQERGDEVLVLAVEKDRDTQLLHDFGIPYKLVEKSTGRNVFEKAWLFIKLCVSYTREARKFKPDILIGRASPMMAVAAWLCGKPHVIFEDTEVSKFSLRICRLLSTEIITPDNFLADLCKKQIRWPIIKEAFFLHPNRFTPDRKILEQHGFQVDQEYCIVRFVAWSASHDVGLRGLSPAQMIECVDALKKHCDRIYITSETALPPALEPMKIPLPYDLIHHALYYAKLVFSEGKSVAMEAALLGTHAVYINPVISGSSSEMERVYQLLYQYSDADVERRLEKGLAKATELLLQPDLVMEGRRKRAVLLEDMQDASAVFIDRMDSIVSKRQPAP